MSLPESLLTDLVDYWTFSAGIDVGTNWTALLQSEGGGPVEHTGHVNSVVLPMRYVGVYLGTGDRNRVGYGKVGVPYEDWVEASSPFDEYVPAGDWCYGGGGAILDLGASVLDTVGQGVTIAQRYLPNGYCTVGSGPVVVWIRNNYRQVLAQVGYLDDTTFREVVTCEFNNEACGLGAAVPFRLRHRSSTNAVTTVNAAGSSVPGAASVISGEFPDWDPIDVIVRFRRVSSTEITMEVFIDGELSGALASKITSDFAATPLDLISIGLVDATYTYGGMFEAAVWSRALTDDEIEAIGEDGLDGLPEIEDDEPAGTGTDNPIVDENGDSALNPDWPVERITDSVVLATEGPQRHTRRPHRIAPRRYRIKAAASKGGEVELINELIRVTRGGAKATRWRHPVDDPPAARIDQLPLYRLISHSVARTRGGQYGTWELVLEQVA